MYSENIEAQNRTHSSDWVILFLGLSFLLYLDMFTFALGFGTTVLVRILCRENWSLVCGLIIAGLIGIEFQIGLELMR